MSLRLLLGSLESGTVVNVRNALVQIVHECVEELAEVERREEVEVEALKEMVHRLEVRCNERVEASRLGLQGEIDVLAKAMEVGGLTAGHLGVGLS